MKLIKHNEGKMRDKMIAIYSETTTMYIYTWFILIENSKRILNTFNKTKFNLLLETT